MFDTLYVERLVEREFRAAVESYMFDADLVHGDRLAREVTSDQDNYRMVIRPDYLIGVEGKYTDTYSNPKIMEKDVYLTAYTKQSRQTEIVVDLRKKTITITSPNVEGFEEVAKAEFVHADDYDVHGALFQFDLDGFVIPDWSTVLLRTEIIIEIQDNVIMEAAPELWREMQEANDGYQRGRWV